MLAKFLIVPLFSAATLLLSVGHAGASPLQAQQLIGPYDDNASVSGINNAGQAVGLAYGVDYQWPQATVWTKGVGVTSGVTGSVSYGNAINNAGLVVGDYLNYNGDYSYSSAFSGGKSTYKDGGIESSMAAVNSGGTIVGNSRANAVLGEAKESMNNPIHATVWNGTTVIDLNPAGAGNSYARGINDSGLVVGQVDGKAAVWNGSDVTFLAGTSANAVNNLGQVVGDANGHAFTWSNGLMVDLGIGSAADINQRGEVVGKSNGLAMLWSNGDAIDLNSFLGQAQRDAGWVLTDATGINDFGWIVANAQNVNTGGFYAFVLSPVPEPATYAMLLIGMFVLAAMARRRNV